MSRGRKIGLTLIGAALALGMSLLFSCSSTPTQPKNPPRITQFVAAPTDIAAGDSTHLTYTVTGADSVILSPPRTKLVNAQSGSVWQKPSLPTLYHLYAYNADGRDSATARITMSANMPLVSVFQPQPDTILFHDSTLLSWTAVRADSIVVNQGVGKLPSAGSGDLWLKPAATTAYRAIAFNQYGTDTITATVVVQTPAHVRAANGLYYKGTMGQNIETPLMQFWVAGPGGELVSKAYMHFRLIEGDGALSVGPNDSLHTDINGLATIFYNFSGTLGHAIVRVKVTGIDSLDVYIRASTLIPGDSGQGQYILLTDTYGMVKAFNGLPASIDTFVSQPCFYYANYEQALGVVAFIGDLGCNGIYSDSDPVVSVIVNTVYSGKTASGIGIGSRIAAIRAAYGAPDSITFDPTPPPAVALWYLSKGMTFYCDSANITHDTVVSEIHLSPISTGKVAALAKPSTSTLSPPANIHGYRRVNY